MTKNRAHKQAVRAAMAATGDNYTRAARHTPAAPTPAAGPFTLSYGWHRDDRTPVTFRLADPRDPHLLVLGRPGAGKSWLGRQLSHRFLAAAPPEARLVVLDAKREWAYDDWGHETRATQIAGHDADAKRAGVAAILAALDSADPTLIVVDGLLAATAGRPTQLRRVLRRVVADGAATNTYLLLLEQRAWVLPAGLGAGFGTRVTLGAGDPQDAEESWVDLFATDQPVPPPTRERPAEGWLRVRSADAPRPVTFHETRPADLPAHVASWWKPGPAAGPGPRRGHVIGVRAPGRPGSSAAVNLAAYLARLQPGKRVALVDADAGTGVTASHLGAWVPNVTALPTTDQPFTGAQLDAAMLHRPSLGLSTLLGPVQAPSDPRALATTYRAAVAALRDSFDYIVLGGPATRDADHPLHRLIDDVSDTLVAVIDDDTALPTGALAAGAEPPHVYLRACSDRCEHTSHPELGTDQPIVQGQVGGAAAPVVVLPSLPGWKRAGGLPTLLISRDDPTADRVFAALVRIVTHRSVQQR